MSATGTKANSASEKSIGLGLIFISASFALFGVN